MAYSTLQTVSTGDLIDPATWGNVVRSNQEDHESRILSIGILRNFISGFEIANGTDADHDIDFSGGQCADSTNASYINDASGMTKRIDATWAAGDGNGGLFSGASLTADTWYYLYVIEKDSDGSIDYGFDDNVNGTNVPAGYTHFRFLGWAVLTDGSSNILGFTQNDNKIRFNTMILDVSTAVSSTSRQTPSVSVPPNFIGTFSSWYRYGTSVVYFWLGATSDTDLAASSSFFDSRTTSTASGAAIFKDIPVDGSSDIAYRSDTAAGTLTIFTESFYRKTD